MASVFLSYDREDKAKAQRIARALETAGHSVWWDRHIKSGAQYSKEIEQALKAADAVIVLWSERSVDSAWVRDEAAAGRDTGRLVPAMIGKVEPPLGFRQYQTTDLSRWKGKANAAQFQEMLGAVESLGSGEKGESIATASKRVTPRLNRFFALGGALAVILIAALIFWRPWQSQPEVPVVAVRPADGSQAAAGLANDLFVQLGSLQSSNAHALQLVEQGGEARPDLIFKIGGNARGQQAGVNLTLLRGKGGNLLWSRDFPPAVRN
ncbi:MAG: toll/interleukin-1 receptor domain-containing protein, partial [Sphingomicrobium sp.]